MLQQPNQQRKKEPTDINALADEYLRLSYHGLRAKDKSFNADLKLTLINLPKNQCHSAGYWQGAAESDKQCVLCGQ
jgi:hypothetical protein